MIGWVKVEEDCRRHAWLVTITLWVQLCVGCSTIKEHYCALRASSGTQIRIDIGADRHDLGDLDC